MKCIITVFVASKLTYHPYKIVLSKVILITNSMNICMLLPQPTDNKNITISPIYLSRMLNSICCSISVCRDDPLSVVALVELARRFTMGLWNCIQFMVCAACSLTVMNLLSAILALPPVFPPGTILYLMCFAIPLISISLARISSDPKVLR